MAYEDQEVSPGYKKLLREVNEKFGSSIPKAILRYLESGHLCSELRLIQFFIDMRYLK